MASTLDSIVFSNTDHFRDAGGIEETKTTTTKSSAKKAAVQGVVHIRNQQRNGRKSLTTVQGLATDLDLKKIVKVMRKMFSTNGTILKDEEHGEVIQLQGDFRKEAAEFLATYNIVEKEMIKVHGA